MNKGKNSEYHFRRGGHNRVWYRKIAPNRMAYRSCCAVKKGFTRLQKPFRCSMNKGLSLDQVTQYACKAVLTHHIKIVQI